MSDTQNPWESPATDLEKLPESTTTSTGEEITGTMRRYLAEASPWLRFIGVMYFIGVGFMALVSLGMIVAGLFSSSLDGTETVLYFSMGAGYLVFSGILILPARFIWNFGTKLRAWKESGNSPDLEEALKNSKSYWKLQGIVMIVYLSIIPVALVIGISAGVLTSLM